MVEPWLRGTLMEFDSVRRQVLHALELAEEDAVRWCAELSEREVHATPAGCASVAFNLRHAAGSLDRLLTYAEGRQLSAEQLGELAREREPLGSTTEVLHAFDVGVADAVRRVRLVQPGTYEQARWVGRQRLPSTVGALLVHCAEHTQRHIGQAVTTARMVTGLGQSERSRLQRRESPE